MTTLATLRSQRTKALPVYHVREPSAGESPTSLIIKIQGYWRSPASACSARPPRHVRLIPECPARLLDHLVRLEQERRRDHEPQSLGGLEVEDQFKPHRPLHWEIARFGPFQDFVYM